MYEDLRNKEFGQLKVLDSEPEIVINKQGKKRRKWNCICKKCNSLSKIWSHNIKINISGCKSCSLKSLQLNNKKGYEEISGIFWSNIITQARLRKIDFNVSIEYCWKLFIKQHRKCVYSGRELIMSPNDKVKRNKHELNIASLDRINSNIGYVEGNIQWVHKTVNLMKNSLSEQEFLSFVKEISTYKELQN